MARPASWKMPSERAFRCDRCNGRRALDQATVVPIDGTDYVLCRRCTDRHHRALRKAEREARKRQKGQKS